MEWLKNIFTSTTRISRLRFNLVLLVALIPATVAQFIGMEQTLTTMWDDMLMSNEESIRGAQNRARAALESGADIGIGIESGVEDFGDYMQMTAWVAVAGKDGTIRLGQTVGIPLPSHWRKAILAGAEIRPLMLESGLPYDYTTGAIGFLTRNTLGRDEQLAAAVVVALASFMNEQAYKAPAEAAA